MPAPPPLGPVVPEGTTILMAEADRQEAIDVVERLSAAYYTAAEDLTHAPEPHFKPLQYGSGDFKSGEPEAGAATGGQHTWRGLAQSHDVPASAVGSGTHGSSGESAGYSHSVGPRATAGGDADSRHLGEYVAPATTSLDGLDAGDSSSGALSLERSAGPSRVASEGGGRSTAPFVRNYGQAPVPPMTNVSFPARPNEPPQNSHPVERPPEARSGNAGQQLLRRPMGGPDGTGAVGTPSGRVPMTSAPGQPVPRGVVPPRSARISGGVPRPSERSRRGLPMGGVVSPGAVPAVRDPATGVVRGAGGGLLGCPGGGRRQMRSGATSSPSLVIGVQEQPTDRLPTDGKASAAVPGNERVRAISGRPLRRERKGRRGVGRRRGVVESAG